MKLLQTRATYLDSPVRSSPPSTSITHAGILLREWRATRRLSQLDLALAADISTRHLSCVETGKAQPSREMVIRLADALDMPLRETQCAARGCRLRGKVPRIRAQHACASANTPCDRVHASTARTLSGVSAQQALGHPDGQSRGNARCPIRAARRKQSAHQHDPSDLRSERSALSYRQLGRSRRRPDSPSARRRRGRTVGYGGARIAR